MSCCGQRAQVWSRLTCGSRPTPPSGPPHGLWHAWSSSKDILDSSEEFYTRAACAKTAPVEWASDVGRDRYSSGHPGGDLGEVPLHTTWRLARFARPTKGDVASVRLPACNDPLGGTWGIPKDFESFVQLFTFWWCLTMQSLRSLKASFLGTMRHLHLGCTSGVGE